jgi:hypothetical protein
MRISLILIPVSLVAAPAAAQTVAPAAPAEPNVVRVPSQIADPATVARLADTMRELSQSLLELHVGTLQATLEGRVPTAAERNLTVRDLARREDPDFERHLQQRIAAARPQIEQSAKALAQSVPEITQDLQRARKSLKRAIANMPDPDYPRR